MGMPKLTPHQDEAVTNAKRWFKDSFGASNEANGTAEFYLGGFAGTGKSTILPVVIDSLNLAPEDVQFCAPTGKAAKVMTEKLKAYGIDRRARTIHSLIYRPKPMQAEMLNRELDGLKSRRSAIIDNLHLNNVVNWKADEALVEVERTMVILEKDLNRLLEKTEGPKFQLNHDSDIRKARLVVVDEASMVGESIANDLRGFYVPIFAMGDPGQLPPVGDVAGLTAGDPDFFLTEIHRQAKDNPIIQLATLAREGKPLRVGNYGDGVEVIARINDRATYDMEREAQVIVGTNKRRWMITKRMRREMQYLSTGPCAGEPLIICKNSKVNPDLVNGAFVHCTHDVGDLVDGNASIRLSIEDEMGNPRNIMAVQGIFEEHRFLQKGKASASKMANFRACMDHEHVDWGWVITCHKSQGSQWDDVILHDESGSWSGDEGAKWLYTGITRAAKRLTVVL